MNISSYFFLNEENIKFNNQCLNTYIGYPQPISQDWPNLPVKFQRHIDDIINLNGFLYFFKGSQYLKFDIAKAEVVDGPKFIVDGWPELKGTEFENGIDAAIELTTNTVCFFKGKYCVDYTIDLHTIKMNTISDRWNITEKYEKFSTNLDAAILWPSIDGNFIYFFKDDSFIRFDQKSNVLDAGPIIISSNHAGWRGLAFKNVQSAVSVDTDLLGSNRDNNGVCSGTYGTNDAGKHCFQLPQSIRFSLIAYTNTDTSQTVKVYIDDILVDTLTGKGQNNIMATKVYTSGTGKICIEIEGNGKPCKLRYFDNTFDGNPGTAIIGAENSTNSHYNDSVVFLNWPLT
ncbi:fucose-binding lectin II [Photorhabdus luminescens]|uniref:Photopexin B n=1 Tax=Photorhabdus luminescens subsp. sonorensis TaxID=1173677 RepID=A0A5C4RF02_PHOLU|nr:fucose-binding lectin II [Photorhabdus luminescens]TNH42318.1 photopexin B [Photorhabdus luminescens subsp. sonorensis]